VVIVVAGGPQYRAGAHRQFVSLARLLAAEGVPVLRFDLRGMGDSSGQYLGYQQSVPDIRAAIDALQAAEPGVTEVVPFGECESASGILFYAYRDPRVVGAALANPWVRTQEVQAQAILKHYYRDRLFSRAFWGHVFSGGFKIGESFSSMVALLRTYLKGRKAARSAVAVGDALDGLPLPVKTAEGLRRFPGRVLFLMSGRDLIAREFDDVTRSSEAWRGLMEQGRVQRVEIASADHTFSKPEAKREAQQTLLGWIRA
jgi:exosortase A-associated hydrolase 1